MDKKNQNESVFTKCKYVDVFEKADHFILINKQ